MGGGGGEISEGKYEMGEKMKSDQGQRAQVHIPSLVTSDPSLGAVKLLGGKKLGQLPPYCVIGQLKL